MLSIIGRRSVGAVARVRRVERKRRILEIKQTNKFRDAQRKVYLEEWVSFICNLYAAASASSFLLRIKSFNGKGLTSPQ